MKKLTTLALAAGLIVAAAAPASAIDTKIDGQYLFTFMREDINYTEQGSDVEFAKQRIRLGLTFTASENLSGYVQFQSAENFGQYHNAVETNTGVRQAYVDWMIPGTPVKVRMGKVQFGQPAHAFGQNLAMGPAQSRSAVIVSAPVADWMNVNAFWQRYDIADKTTDYADVSAGSKDAFGVNATMKFDGLTITPWAMYAADSATNQETYWAEATAALTMFDPLTVKATVGGAYSNVKGEEDIYAWHAMALASYKMSFGTPVFGFWYGDGADKGEAVAKRQMPKVGGGKFAPSFGFYSATYGLDDSRTGLANGTSGTWGLKLGIENVSFLNGLTHNFAVVMAKGTNHDNAVADGSAPYGNMTWSDTMYDFNFESTYQIYKNLAANLQLAYILNDADEDKHAGFDEDGWRAALTFQYKF